VHDLRVLGVNFEPPELMAPACPSGNPADPKCVGVAFGAFGADLKMTWLIEDPKGASRHLSYRVLACANANDLKCENEGDFKQLAAGETDGGDELTLNLRPGLTQVADGFLLQEVLSQDSYKGLGGARMPIVLRLNGADEEVYAQKLMVFSYPFFPTMKPNVNPRLPGIMFADGGIWGEHDVPQFQGHADAGVKLEPVPFEALQEEYVVPSFELKPLTLNESWKISWTADLGHFSPTETGGVGFAGDEGKHRVVWNALGANTTESDVHFWFVVRDGRGGQTWLRRTAHWKP
jgi:hypothetical protein